MLSFSRVQCSLIVHGACSLGAHRLIVENDARGPSCAAVPLVLSLCSGHDVFEGCYLVDPASSHMLVSKIKPCMCKYELIQTVKLRMAH